MPSLGVRSPCVYRTKTMKFCEIAVWMKEKIKGPIMQFEKLHTCSGCYCSLQVKWRQNFFSDEAVGGSKNIKNRKGFG